jgi:3-oxoacyl-[acyl-carrier protein] reductase
VSRRRVVVGGASSGLGRAVAETFARDGAHLLLWARDPDRLEATAADLRALHPTCTVDVISADAGDPAAAATVAAAALEALGGVDVLILNAGGPPACAPTETDADQWRSALQLLTVTPIDLATRLLPAMRAQGQGRVVAILSSGVREPLADLAYSNSGRSALSAWMKTVSSAVAPDRVTVNGVIPGRIDTDRVARLDAARAAREQRPVDEVRSTSTAAIPMGRYGTPAEFAAAVAFLASDAASYITGSFLSCDGGLSRGTW